MVLSKKSISNQPPKLGQKGPDNNISPRNNTNPGPNNSNIKQLPSPPGRDTRSSPQKSKYSKDNAQDIDFREINEAIKDLHATDTLDENDVESIFSILASTDPASELLGKNNKDKKSDKKSPDGKSQENSPENPAKKQEDIKKMIRVIRDTMTPTQRKMLWRALIADKEQVSEAHINPPDVKAVLKGASSIRSNPSIINRLPGFKKDKISVGDLQKAWAEGDAEKGIPQYSDDTRDIKYILTKKFGYSDNEINKVFSKVFGGSVKKPNEPTQSNTIQKFAEYAKKNGIEDDIIAFMKREFAKELDLSQEKTGIMKQLGGLFKRKAVAEEIRDIFTSIVNEERLDRHLLVKDFHTTHLGRTKK